MTKEPTWAARGLLDKLEDPFTMFPVESVASVLYHEVEEAETRKVDCTNPWDPAARKFWSVEKEHLHETIGLLLGALFVLGQATITQTECVLNQLRKLPRGDSAIPKEKDSKLRLYAATETKTGLSTIVIVNAVSNYFKHGYAWPEQWDVVAKNGSKREAETIDIVRRLGMDQNYEMTDNLLLAADCLALGSSDSTTLASNIQNWREGWARALYPHFGLPDPT